MSFDDESLPPCPVDGATGAWIDRRWDWLTTQFGSDRVKSATVVLPQPEFFPDAFDGTFEDAQKLLYRLCRYMGLDAATVTLDVYVDRPPSPDGEFRKSTAGLYEKVGDHFFIWIEETNLDDPIGLISTLAHELAHVHLLGHGRVTADEHDHEQLTDLLTVFLGVGILTANSVVHESYWDSGTHSGWSIGRRGYLTMQEYGYALARFARDRGEEEPGWAGHLRLDVRDAFDKAMRFLASGRQHESAEPGKRVAAPPPVDEEFVEETSDDNAPAMVRSVLVERLANGERDFSKCNFADCDLKGLDLRACRFCEADFDHADLTDADLSECTLSEADLQAAIMVRTRLRNASAFEADFSFAALLEADFTGADIRGADFSHARLAGTIFNETLRDRSTNFADADLSEIVCDADLMSEDLTGISTSDSIGELGTRFGDLVFMFFFACLTGFIGALAIGAVGIILDRIVGRPVADNFFNLAGAFIGFIWGIRTMGRWRLQRVEQNRADSRE